MPWNSGGSGPWGDPPEEPDNSDKNDGKKPPKEPVQGPWGGTSSGPGKSGRPGGGSKSGNGGNGGGRGGGPFGSGSFDGGGGGNELDRLIASLQRTVGTMLGGGGRGPNGAGGGGGSGGRWFGGRRSLFLLAGLVVVVWLGTGIYRVEPDEQGVVMHFGAYSYWTPPGLHWHLPWPVESVETPSVTQVNTTEIGYRCNVAGNSARGEQNCSKSDIPSESLMLTGDENIIDIQMSVFWKISNAPDYLFNTVNPAALVRAVAESSLREVIGRTAIQTALTGSRDEIAAAVQAETQTILDRYKAGVAIETISGQPDDNQKESKTTLQAATAGVQLQGVNPPAQVIESFHDVQSASADADRVRNEAEAYRNDVVPRARGDAARIIAEGEGAKAANVAKANGEAQRFDSVLKAYQQAKDITVRRLYLDTMEDILTHSQPLVVDDKLKGLVPFLQLGTAGVRAPAPPSNQVPPAPPASSGGTNP